MRSVIIIILLSTTLSYSCSSSPGQPSTENSVADSSAAAVTIEAPKPKRPEIIIEKELTYDKYTLADSYPYKDTVRVFQWDKIRSNLTLIDSIQQTKARYGILQNRKNINGEAPLVKVYSRNTYKRIQDEFEVERYQSVPVYAPADTLTPERYGRDGSLVKIEGESGSFNKIENINFSGEWFVPKKYIKPIEIDTLIFRHVIFVDRENQNIATMEKVGNKWMVRSMNPATTGLYRPPVYMVTPLGIFVIQEKKAKMIYLNDAGTTTGGFAPWASRFCNGAYIHGVPVNAPHTAMVEYSATLGTTPRSHMCVRNVTSHAKFVYDNFPTLQSLVVVIE